VELKEIFQYVNNLNEKLPNPDLCAILGLIALDHHETFELDRESALMQCLEWSMRGIDINPQHYHCNRNAGSALYWLNDMKGALKYYEKSNELRSSPVLQIRMFNIRNGNNEFPNFAELTVSLDTDSAMEAYNAGVEINWILERNPGMLETQYERLTLLKRQLYERAYHLYRNTLILGNGDRFNHDPHTFAMCCNNLARELNFEGAYQEAIAVASEGIGQSALMFILLNRINSYLHAHMPEKAIGDAMTLLEDYGDEMDVITIISVIDSLFMSYMEIKQYKEALNWADKGLEIYHQLDPTDPIMQDETIIRCVTNFFINKSKSSAELGLAVDTVDYSQEADILLEEMPDNPSLMISRADAFMKEGEWQKAMEFYDQAVHFGLQKEQERSVQVALYNRGYIQEVYLKNNEAALENFEQSIHYGNTTFGVITGLFTVRITC
jgi:tetratricopeptide (TPR) repeat protein